MEIIKKVEVPKNEFPVNYFSYKRIMVIILGLFLVSIFGIYFKYKLVIIQQDKIKKNNEAYLKSLLENDPKALQDSLVEAIKNGVNDKYTKSDAYFITHRFFDNGGNIYEIYDYVSSHPELVFLKEAESIYPGVFKLINERKLSTAPVDGAYYAYLAYLEILNNHGYADIAALGTMSNQYAKIAFFNSTLAKEMTKEEGKAYLKYVKRDIKKSMKFLNISNNIVSEIVNNKGIQDNITSRDILVGLNQYAAALRYLEALRVNTTTTKTSNEVFAFTMDYSHRNVPELIHFTSILNASTLAVLSSSTPSEVRTALYPILDLDTKKVKILDTSIIHKIIDTRFEEKTAIIGDMNMDIYGKRNTLRLTEKVPEFKTWLIYNGWVEEDFK